MSPVRHQTLLERLIWLGERAGYYRAYIREHPETAAYMLKVADRYSRDAAELAGSVRDDGRDDGLRGRSCS